MAGSLGSGSARTFVVLWGEMVMEQSYGTGLSDRAYSLGNATLGLIIAGLCGRVGGFIARFFGTCAQIARQLGTRVTAPQVYADTT